MTDNAHSEYASELRLIVNGSPHSEPLGTKGIGEIGIVGVAAAVANAVWHATGVRHRGIPIRPDHVLLGSS